MAPMAMKGPRHTVARGRCQLPSVALSFASRLAALFIFGLVACLGATAAEVESSHCTRKGSKSGQNCPVELVILAGGLFPEEHEDDKGTYDKESNQAPDGTLRQRQAF